jgi:broad specificity phosphatase PhoE
MRTRFIVIRHAETPASLERRFVGSTDVDLTDHGFECAKALAQRLRQVRIDALHVSPLRRCQQTAEAITAVTGRKATIVPELRECAFGVLEGFTLQEAADKFGDDLAAWFGGEDTCPPDGETWSAVGERIKEWFESAAERYDGRTVCAVTHGGPILTLARQVTKSPYSSMVVFEIDPCSITVVQQRGDLWRLRLWNDTTHLRDPLLDGSAPRRMP